MLETANLESVPCNNCGQTDDLELSTRGQFGLPLRIVICRNCALVYLNPRWTRTKYLDFYTSEYDKYYRPSIGKEPTDNVTSEIVHNRMLGFAKDIAPPESILDIGAGSGDLLSYLASRFDTNRLFAIEPSEGAQNKLAELNIEVLASDIEADWEKEFYGQIDLVIMRHVLEHFHDPQLALNKAAAALSPNGLIYIAVPNNMKPKPPLESYWFRVVHTYYFSESTLRSLLAKSGLNVLKLRQGDDDGPHELFCVCSRGSVATESNIDANAFQQQMLVLSSLLESERSLPYRFKRTLAKLKAGIARILRR